MLVAQIMPWSWHDQQNSWNDGWNWGPQGSSPGKTRGGTREDNLPWSQKYTYLNGPHKQSHTLPLEDRVWLARIIVEQSQSATDHGAAPMKLPLVKTLSWPVDIVDAVIFLLTGLSRRTSLRSLGETQEQVAETLTEAFISRMPNPQDRHDLISGIIENAENHENLLEWALEGGFQAGWPQPRLDSRSRMGSAAGAASLGVQQRPPPLATAVASATGHGASGGGARHLGRKNTDETIEHLEKRRKVAEMEKLVAAAELDKAKHKQSLAKLQAQESSAAAEEPSSLALTGNAALASSAVALGMSASQGKRPFEALGGYAGEDELSQARGRARAIQAVAGPATDHGAVAPCEVALAKQGSVTQQQEISNVQITKTDTSSSALTGSATLASSSAALGMSASQGRPPLVALGDHSGEAELSQAPARANEVVAAGQNSATDHGAVAPCEVALAKQGSVTQRQEISNTELVQKLHSELQEAHKEFETQQQQHSEVLQEMSRANDVVHEELRDNRALQAESMSELQEQFKASVAEHAELQEHMQVVLEKNTQLEGVDHSWQSEFQEQKAEMESLRENLQATDRSRQSEFQEQKTEIQSLREHLSRVNLELSTCKSKIESSDFRAEKLEMQLEVQAARLGQATAMSEAYESKAKAMALELAQAQAKQGDGDDQDEASHDE